MKRILNAYKDLIGIIFAEAPFIVVLTFVCSIVNGLLIPMGVYINQQVFDGGLAVARNEMTFSNYSVFLVLFVISALLPSVISGVVYNYVQPHSLLILRTAYKVRLLKKLKTMKYEHFESEVSMEIIDKAYNRAENSARHLWPMYIYRWLSSVIAGIGSLAYIFSIRWWLLLTVMIPFILETYLSTKVSFNIYTELETYWTREKRYGMLGGYLRSRDYSKELKAFGNADYLIDTYKNRLNERNRDYEKYYFKNLRHILLGGNLTRFASVANVLVLLFLFVNGHITVGLFVAMTSLLLSSLYNSLGGSTFLFKWAPFHINSYDYYDRFFELSDESEGTDTKLPTSFDIEFRDVWFRYPGTKEDILKGLSFKIKSGEKASIVGENGEGKSTMIKLLLGLFSPDQGQILIGGKNISDYPLSVRTKIFGPVLQDFSRYSITFKENIGIGDVDHIDNEEKIKAAAEKGKVHEIIQSYEKRYDTLLGRHFEGGTDISGGQWQRVALARAFMGDKPILLLDEPTSQLDPMAEADLYTEFADMTEDKTALFVTHRLGSTLITDRIFVIHGGTIQETGTHTELMQIDGIYSKMFNAQKQWYKHKGNEAASHV